MSNCLTDWYKAPGAYAELDRGRSWGETLSELELRDLITAREAQALFRPARADKYRRGKAMHPYPAYVATFADGRITRTSFYSEVGKPLNVAHGYNMATLLARAAPIGGYVDMGETQAPDPFFSGEADQAPAAPIKQASPAARLKALVAAIRSGDVDQVRELLARES